jgi:hypothetical protein
MDRFGIKCPGVLAGICFENYP